MSTKHRVTVLASASRTATANSGDQLSSGASGIHLVLDVTVVTGTGPTLDVKIQRKDSLSGKYVDLPGAAFAQKAGVGTDDLVVYPGVAETANRSVSDVISEEWRAVATIGGTTPDFTFSLAGSYIP